MKIYLLLTISILLNCQFLLAFNINSDPQREDMYLQREQTRDLQFYEDRNLEHERTRDIQFLEDRDLQWEQTHDIQFEQNKFLQQERELNR